VTAKFQGVKKPEKRGGLFRGRGMGEAGRTGLKKK